MMSTFYNNRESPYTTTTAAPHGEQTPVNPEDVVSNSTTTKQLEHESPRSTLPADAADWSVGKPIQTSNLFVYPKVPSINQASEQDDEDETPADVARLLASVASIASQEIKKDPPIMKELASLAFPDLSKNDQNENDDMELDGVAPPPLLAGIESMRHFAQYAHQVPLLHYNHYSVDTSKTRAVSMDSPELRAIEGPSSFEGEAVPTLLQWRSIPNSYSNNGIYSTPPPSPPRRHDPYTMSHAHDRGVNSEYRRAKSKVVIKEPNVESPTMSTKNRPRSVSLAEPASQHHGGHHRRHASSGGVSLSSMTHHKNGKSKQLILRKKFCEN